MSTDLHAAIDIGTNTVLLLVAEKNGDLLEPVLEEQRIPRLGKGVDASGNLSDSSIGKVLNALKEYRDILTSHYPHVASLTVTATSAVRDAANRNHLIDAVRNEAGFEIKLLSGEEEAEYTYTGALSTLPEIDGALVIDIGGGSTEIAYGKKGVLNDCYSFDMGSVRYTERFINSDPPDKLQVIRCREAVKRELQNRLIAFNQGNQKIPLVGVAGTVTSLAYMDLGLTQYDTDQINSYNITSENISQWVEEISRTSVTSLVQRYPEVMKGRAEIILAGLLILDEFMNFYDIPDLVVSTGGIRHGAILLGNKKGDIL